MFEGMELYQSRRGFVQEGEPRQLGLELPQLLVPGLVHGDGLDGVQLGPEVVQEQGVDDLVDVLDGGVVHPAGAPGLLVQGALKDGAEDGGADH